MRALSHVVPLALRELLRNTPTSPGKVAFAWATAVGPALQGSTAVRLVQRTLIVETSSAQWTKEVRRSTATILPRLQALLGADAVTRLEVRTNPNLQSHNQSAI